MGYKVVLVYVVTDRKPRRVGFRLLIYKHDPGTDKPFGFDALVNRCTYMQSQRTVGYDRGNESPAMDR
jgi:hypothetical protein